MARADRRPPIGTRLLVGTGPVPPGMGSTARVVAHERQYVYAEDEQGQRFCFHVLDDRLPGTNGWDAAYLGAYPYPHSRPRRRLLVLDDSHLQDAQPLRLLSSPHEQLLLAAALTSLAVSDLLDPLPSEIDWTRIEAAADPPGLPEPTEVW